MTAKMLIFFAQQPIKYNSSLKAMWSKGKRESTSGYSIFCHPNSFFQCSIIVQFVLLFTMLFQLMRPVMGKRTIPIAQFQISTPKSDPIADRSKREKKKKGRRLLLVLEGQASKVKWNDINHRKYNSAFGTTVKTRQTFRIFPRNFRLRLVKSDGIQKRPRLTWWLSIRFPCFRFFGGDKKRSEGVLNMEFKKKRANVWRVSWHSMYNAVSVEDINTFEIHSAMTLTTSSTMALLARMRWECITCWHSFQCHYTLISRLHFRVTPGCSHGITVAPRIKLPYESVGPGPMWVLRLGWAGLSGPCCPMLIHIDYIYLIN